jgi:hypothetical protein
MVSFCDKVQICWLVDAWDHHLISIDIARKLRIITVVERRVCMKPSELWLLPASIRSSLIRRICVVMVFLTITLIKAEWPGVGENLPVCVAPGETYEPQIVSDGYDGCLIVWFDTRSGMDSINVFGQRVSADGDTLWPESGVQFTNIQSYTWVSYLVACADYSGGAFFAWEDPRNGDFDVYVQHVDSSGAALWTDNGIRLSMTSDAEYVMDIAPDESGGCIVAWNTASTIEAIMAQRLSASGMKVWDSAGVVVSSGTDIATRAQIEPDGHGGIVACWLDGRYHPVWNDFKDIYAQRIDSSGTVSWADTGVVLLGLGSAPFYSFPQMVSNGAGRFFVTWYDWRSGGFDIYAQCISDSGQMLWAANGSGVCTSPGEQTGPRIAPSFSDGLFCIWHDNYTSIRGQLLDANGMMIWPSSGIIIASSSSELSVGNAFQTSNGLYALIYGECVGSTTSELVKAQALDPSGNMVWAAGGELVSTVVSPKSDITAIPDTCGGLIAVWRDDRNGSYASDLFAQRVDPSVGIVETESSSGCIMSVRCAPNPFSSSVRLEYDLKQATAVVLDIYDIKGSRITSLSPGFQTVGLHEINWDAKDATGLSLPGGIYFLVLKAAGSEGVMRKLVLLQ